MKVTEVWSFGGGTQSAAIAVMVHGGVLPRPDLVVIADTGREASTTWAYLEEVVRPLLLEVDVEVHRAPHSLAKVDLFSHGGELLLPVYRREGARLSAFCSSEWKREVVSRWLRGRGVQAARNWLGISADEARRVSRPRKAWLQLWYPLVEMGITREACYAIVEAAGLPRPPMSACWCCPHRSAKRWRELAVESPADFAAAVELDERLRADDLLAGGDGVFLHTSRRPLRLVAGDGLGGGGQELGCDSGECWT